MNILILGSGGREHALAWKCAQSSQLTKLFVAPGNAGTNNVATNVDLDYNDFEAVANFAVSQSINTIIVGPEDPLVKGIRDYFDKRDELSAITVIGPNKAGAQLEGSKDFAKKFMKKYNIPTAKYATFTKENINDGYGYLELSKPPYVLKADGLAGGKGVLILDDLKQAKSELKKMLVGSKFGKASKKVVIEQFLDGVEVSYFVISDGTHYKILPEAKDYKRIGANDTGLNTGGMGAVSPVPFATRDFTDKVVNQVIIPTIKGLKKEGIHYSGFIFFGLINVKNDPYVIEYNCRLGDPETEVIMPRLKSDILDLFDGIATGTLGERDIEIDTRHAATVMMVSGGYPEKYETGKQILGLKEYDNSVVFHAGTKTSDSGALLTNGGRVIAVTSYGRDIAKAVKATYATIDGISFDKANYRKDIGFDLI